MNRIPLILAKDAAQQIAGALTDALNRGAELSEQEIADAVLHVLQSLQWEKGAL